MEISRRWVALAVAAAGLASACSSYEVKGTSVPNRAAAPTIVPGTTSSTSAITASISCSTSGTLPYRTTDGSAPTTSSTQSGTATFTASGTLRAICAGGGVATSAEASATYTIVTVGGGGGLMPAATITQWSPGIPGGVPSATTVYTTLSPNGTGDSSGAINSAIQGAGAAYRTSGQLQVVSLSAGTFFCSSMVMLNQDGVVLRGAGPSATRLVGSQGGAPVVDIGDKNSYGSVISVTADALKDTKTLTLSNASSIAVGDILQLDQVDSPKGQVTAVGTGSADGVHYLNGYVYFADGIYFKRQTMSSAGMDDNGPYYVGTPWSDGCGGGGSFKSLINCNAQNAGPFRSILQEVEVAGKSGNTLTLSDPLHVDFTVARQAQVYKVVPKDTSGDLGTRYAGLEELAVAGGKNNNIVLMNAAYSWVRHVESDGQAVSGNSSKPGMTGQSIFLSHCYRCVVRDSYVHHATSIVQGGGAYGISLSEGSSECLIENNISIFFDKPIVLGVTGGGNVVAYNYVDNALIEGTDWQENAIDDCHEAGSHMDLIEGNWTPNLGPDTTHGSSHWMTHFRNYASGRNSGSYNSTLAVSNLRAFGADAYSGWNNVVGNVLQGAAVGTPSYEISGQPTGTPNDADNGWVWRLGGNGDGGTGGVWDDGTAKANLYRHGNWDNVSNAVVWDPSNSNHTLPSSLYLAAKPAFFGSNAWPWVDPTAATAQTRVQTLPAKARYDAGTPNNLP